MNVTPKEQIEAIWKKQRDHQWTMKAEPIAKRIVRLKKLEQMIEKRTSEIKEALQKDLGKSSMESELTEISNSIAEIRFAIKHLNSWTAVQKVKTPMTLFGTKSFLIHEPKGTVLIVAPWNYPFFLLTSPLISAIAAGNNAVLKPSELAPHTSAMVCKLFSETFPEEEIAVVEGGVEASTALLDLQWDHIFFTGGSRVGKVIATAAAKYLTPTTLELGGKSPAIILDDADLKMTADKLVWGKFINAGQTCVAPDYVWVSEHQSEKFYDLVRESLTKLFNRPEADWKKSESYARIINPQHFARLKRMYDEAKGLGAKTIVGGQFESESKFIAPTVVTNIPNQAEIWREEIFGPLLPVRTYKQENEIKDYLRKQEKPLAMYLFSEEQSRIQDWLEGTTSGGGCINETLIHLVNPYLPFGGVGNSGYGNCHGFFGFQTFSHVRGVLRGSKFAMNQVFYPPYTSTKEKWFIRLIRTLS